MGVNKNKHFHLNIKENKTAGFLQVVHHEKSKSNWVPINETMKIGKHLDVNTNKSYVVTGHSSNSSQLSQYLDTGVAFRMISRSHIMHPCKII